MLENLKYLFIILVISIPIFWMVKYTFASLLPEDQITRYRNVWIAITLIIFISHNFWLYVVLSVIAIQLAQLRESNKVAIYFVLLFAMPPVWIGVAGLGIDKLFEMNSSRLLELAILLPAFLTLVNQKDSLAFGSTTPDKLLGAYLLLVVAFQLRGTSITDTLRIGLYAFTDIFLPYYVISRSLRDIGHFKVAMAAFVVAAILLSGSAIYEYASFQLLYASLGKDLNAQIQLTSMLARDNSLRAIVTTGQPIVLGYVVMVGLGFFLYIKRFISHFVARQLLLALLAGGSFAAISRGPWVGVLAMLIVFIALGHRPIRNMSLLIAGSVLAFSLAATLPGGERLINLLPFIGKTESGDVEYRKDLFTHALIVIQRNPMFGSTDYLNTPEMKAMLQGQGIIDVVNSYLGIALANGLLGLVLFASFFLSILWGIYNALRQFQTLQVEHLIFGAKRFLARPEVRLDEHYMLGVTLLAVLIAILITISTVSSIVLIPVVYWAVAGMGVAYIQMLRRNRN